MADIFHPHFKLDRAKEHLDALEIGIAAFKESKTHRITTEDDIQGGWYIIKIEFIAPFPFHLAMVAGDFICCLRSCLDHLIWELATLTTSTPHQEIAFPVCEKDSVDAQIKIVRATYGIPESALSLVKQLQPYHSGDAYKLSHLWRLNKLWNIDKHRFILSGRVPTDWIFNVPGGFDPIAEGLDNGGVVKLPLAMKDKVRLNPKIGVDVHFGDPIEGVLVTFKDFVDMYNFVANTVLPAFFGFFT